MTEKEACSSCSCDNGTEELKTEFCFCVMGRRLEIGRVLACSRTEVLSPYLVIACKMVSIVPSLLLCTFLRNGGGHLSGSTLPRGSVSQVELPLQIGAGLPHAVFPC